MKSRCFTTVLLLALSFVAGAFVVTFRLNPASAQGGDAMTEMARQRFQEGVKFYDQKKYEESRAAFLQAYALKHHPAVLLNLAQAELRSNHPVDAAFWKTMIRVGKPNSMMPGFAHDQNGPLSPAQIDSLVSYLMTEFPRDHKPTPQIKPPEASPPAANHAALNPAGH